MLFSVASNMTLLTHEHFVHRDYTKFPTTKASFVYLHSWKQWWANVLQSNEVSYFKGVRHHNATTNRSPPWMIPALVFYRHILENLGLSGKACLSGCVLIPWQHSVTVLSRGSASAAHSIHMSITTRLRGRTVVWKWFLWYKTTFFLRFSPTKD